MDMQPTQKKSLRETLAENRKAEQDWAAMCGKELRADLPIIKEKRLRAANSASTVALPTEHQEQAAFIKWFRLQHNGVLVYAIPNAAARSVQLAAYLKAEGFVSGMPDLHIPEWNTWIEFKRQKGGVVSDRQTLIHEHLRKIGQRVIVARGFDDAVAQLHTR